MVTDEAGEIWDKRRSHSEALCSISPKSHPNMTVMHTSLQYAKLISRSLLDQYKVLKVEFRYLFPLMAMLV